MSQLNTVLVQFEDDRHNYHTDVSATTTKESATAYFVGTTFNIGKGGHDNMQKCIGIEYYPAFEVGKKYKSLNLLIECTENRCSGFSGRVLKVSGEARLVWTVGEVFKHFSKNAFTPV